MAASQVSEVETAMKQAMKTNVIDQAELQYRHDELTTARARPRGTGCGWG